MACEYTLSYPSCTFPTDVREVTFSRSCLFAVMSIQLILSRTIEAMLLVHSFPLGTPPTDSLVTVHVGCRRAAYHC